MFYILDLCMLIFSTTLGRFSSIQFTFICSVFNDTYCFIAASSKMKVSTLQFRVICYQRYQNNVNKAIMHSCKTMTMMQLVKVHISYIINKIFPKRNKNEGRMHFSYFFHFIFHFSTLSFNG